MLHPLRYLGCSHQLLHAVTRFPVSIRLFLSLSRRFLFFRFCFRLVLPRTRVLAPSSSPLARSSSVCVCVRAYSFICLLLTAPGTRTHTHTHIHTSLPCGALNGHSHLLSPQVTTTGIHSSAVRVPDDPRGCTPTPIDVSAARDVTISWLSHTESFLVLEWTEGERDRQAQQQEQRQRRKEQQQQPATTADGLLAEATAAGLRCTGVALSSRSSSSSEDDPDDGRRAQGLVPLHCDHTPFPFHRSSGVIFDLPPSQFDGGSSTVSAGILSDCGKRARSVIDKVPVGIDYYTALQKAWSRTPEQLPRLPPLATESEVNLSDIEDVLSGDSDYEELCPPVPLGLMISYFTVDWRDSGLYDVVQRREETLSLQSPMKIL